MKARSLLLLVAALGMSVLPSACLGANTLLSSFEGDLSSTLGPSWTIDSPPFNASFDGVGATDGSQALKLEHNTGWSQFVSLDGGTALANLVASSDSFSLDAWVPETRDWRQVFIIMQGAGQSWSQHQFDLPAGSSTATLDLVATGIKANAAAGDRGWWQVFLAFQGGDVGGASRISTTIDNVRFSAIPEPATQTLLVMVMSSMLLGPRWGKWGKG